MDTDLITNHQAKLKAEKNRLQELLNKVNAELDELEVALNVLLRLSGKKEASHNFTRVRPPPGVNHPKRSKPVKRRRPEKPAGLPTIREMVLEALMDARQRGLPGLAPKGIRKYVIETYDYNMGPSANTVPSRMWHDTKEIQKNTKTGYFSLPHKVEPEDDLLSRAPSSGSEPKPHAQGREAVPGGGP